MKKFRRKPDVISGIQVSDANIKEVAELLNASFKHDDAGQYLHWNGDIVAVGNYVYMVDGEYKKMEANEFESIYDPID